MNRRQSGHFEAGNQLQSRQIGCRVFSPCFHAAMQVDRASQRASALHNRLRYSHFWHLSSQACVRRGMPLCLQQTVHATNLARFESKDAKSEVGATVLATRIKLSCWPAHCGRSLCWPCTWQLHRPARRLWQRSGLAGQQAYSVHRCRGVSGWDGMCFEHDGGNGSPNQANRKRGSGSCPKQAGRQAESSTALPPGCSSRAGTWQGHQTRCSMPCF